ncbi:hypothetical protein F2P81_008953 [Scophthalmus maximus]|uniref:Uncharacterized protein n=1 Tax=Scophthalmus maximus TaxID=52904 RepID=A0A6A4T0D1_SCOMX|nr:hypothetical protein F2P81_008953 [Scophthalmus maximus]
MPIPRLHVLMVRLVVCHSCSTGTYLFPRVGALLTFEDRSLAQQASGNRHKIRSRVYAHTIFGLALKMLFKNTKPNQRPPLSNVHPHINFNNTIQHTSDSYRDFKLNRMRCGMMFANRGCNKRKFYHHSSLPLEKKRFKSRPHFSEHDPAQVVFFQVNWMTAVASVYHLSPAAGPAKPYARTQGGLSHGGLVLWSTAEAKPPDHMGTNNAVSHYHIFSDKIACRNFCKHGSFVMEVWRYKDESEADPDLTFRVRYVCLENGITLRMHQTNGTERVIRCNTTVVAVVTMTCDCDSHSAKATVRHAFTRRNSHNIKP